MKGCAKLNQADQTDSGAVEAAIRELFGSAGKDPSILPGFACDNGKNIHVGEEFLVNYNVTILDIAPVSIGDYDLVPILDTFIDEHPDFSYRGAKGTIALTGYDGILGYRTDICYKTRENLQPDQQKFLDDNPDFDEAAWEKDREDAKKVAEAMMADGWDFASHTWGHMNVGERDLAAIQSDTVKWQENVEPLIGKTNIIIFAFGADIGSWEGYGSDNEKFTYLKSQGFDIYCNVDSTKYWVQFGSNYMRQGRRNLDGYRMYYSPELVTDLFDVSAVWDSSRPTPVPQM